MRKLVYGLLAVLILSFGFSKGEPVYAADNTSTLTIVADENTSRATAANATGQLEGLVSGFYAADHFIVTGLIRYDVERNGQQYEVVVPGTGDVVTLTVYIVEPGAVTPEPPTEPETPVEEPTEPETPVEEPTTPETPVEEPTEPEAPIEEPTTPETPVEEPTEPEAPVEEPTTPETPVEEPTEPEAPVEEPTTPETPVEEPTEPEAPVEEPTTPETPVEEPTEPEAPVEEPTTPETPVTDPNTPVTTPDSSNEDSTVVVNPVDNDSETPTSSNEQVVKETNTAENNSGVVTKQNDSNEVTEAQSTTSETSSSKYAEKTLPQTGDDNKSSHNTLIGIILVTVAAAGAVLFASRKAILKK